MRIFSLPMNAVFIGICALVLYRPSWADKFNNTGVGTINTCDSITVVGVGVVSPDSLSGETNLALGKTPLWGEGGQIELSSDGSPDGKGFFLDNYQYGDTTIIRFLFGNNHETTSFWAYLNLVSGEFVATSLRATSINITGGGGWHFPDYVFEPGYKPLSLMETEKFVRAHKHLPDIPNASEISRDGINLGDLNLKLLKQVEELTLHAIEQEKRIQSLEQKLGKSGGNQ